MCGDGILVFKAWKFLTCNLGMARLFNVFQDVLFCTVTSMIGWIHVIVSIYSKCMATM